MVDLPEPDGPTIDMNSPGRICRDTSRRRRPRPPRRRRARPTRARAAAARTAPCSTVRRRQPVGGVSVRRASAEPRTARHRRLVDLDDHHLAEAQALGDLDVGALGEPGRHRHLGDPAAPARSITRTTSWPDPVLLDRGDGDGQGVVHLLVDDGDRHLRAVGAVQVGHLDACPRRPAGTARELPTTRSGSVSSSVMTPGARVFSPAIWTVQGWPTSSLLRSAAEAAG